MRSTILMLTSVLIGSFMTSAMANEIRPMSPAFDVEKIQDMNQKLQIMHQRHMYETQEMQQRHMKEVHEQNMKQMQETQMMHKQMRGS